MIECTGCEEYPFGCGSPDCLTGKNAETEYLPCKYTDDKKCYLEEYDEEVCLRCSNYYP
jgi:hypothetical protein